MQPNKPVPVFARGDRILFRPWWSERELLEAEVLARYAARRTYYSVRPTAGDPHVRTIRADCIVARA
jgi:hypothetical protein